MVVSVWRLAYPGGLIYLGRYLSRYLSRHVWPSRLVNSAPNKFEVNPPPPTLEHYTFHAFLLFGVFCMSIGNQALVVRLGQ